MHLGLDYDDTFDRDPGFWREVVRLAQSRGHTVFVVTFRGADKCADIAANLDVEIVASGGRPKREACERAGLSIDVWIDDMPELIPLPSELMDWNKKIV
jgi:hypothetical protein